MKTSCTAAILVAVALGAASALAVPSVRYADGRLTAHLENADASEVLREIARQARLEVRGAPLALPPVSMQLDGVPLADALPRILGGQSFALTYGSEGLKGVRLLNGADATAWIISGVPDAAAPVLADEGPAESLVASHRPVALGGRLARAVGADEGSFSQILGVAMQNPDPRVRADALRVSLRILAMEPALHADLIRTLDGFDDQALARWLARTAGEYAAEVAGRAARGPGLGALRTRAAAVERILASAPGVALPGR